MEPFGDQTRLRRRCNLPADHVVGDGNVAEYIRDHHVEALPLRRYRATWWTLVMPRESRYRLIRAVSVAVGSSSAAGGGQSVHAADHVSGLPVESLGEGGEQGPDHQTPGSPDESSVARALSPPTRARFRDS